MSLDQGALIEPLSIAMNANDRAELPDHATVLVLGAGPMGLLCAAMAKATGAKAVVIVDAQHDRNTFAVRERFADSAILIDANLPTPTEAKLKYARDIADFFRRDFGEPDAVFECTGAENCLQAAIYVSTQSQVDVKIKKLISHRLRSPEARS